MVTKAYDMNIKYLPNKYISDVKQPNIIAKPSFYLGIALLNQTQSHTCISYIQLSLPAQALPLHTNRRCITYHFSLAHNVSLLLSQKNLVLITEKHLREHPSIPILYLSELTQRKGAAMVAKSEIKAL